MTANRGLIRRLTWADRSAHWCCLAEGIGLLVCDCLQGPIADRAKLLARPGGMYRQDLRDQTRVELIATLPSVSTVHYDDHQPSLFETVHACVCQQLYYVV